MNRRGFLKSILGAGAAALATQLPGFMRPKPGEGWRFVHKKVSGFSGAYKWEGPFVDVIPPWPSGHDHISSETSYILKQMSEGAARRMGEHQAQAFFGVTT